MLPINYGSFFTLAEAKTAKFNYFKPLIKLITNGIFVFSLIGFLLSAGCFAFAVVMKPQQKYDTQNYQSANQLSAKVSNSLNTMKAARPLDINVCSIIDRFLISRPKDISIRNINIKPDKYTIKGCATSMDGASAYSQSVLFGAKKLVSLNDVKTKNDVVYWTIDVTTKEEGVK